MSEEQNKDSPPLTDNNQQQGPPLNNPSTDEIIVPAETSAESEQQQTTNDQPQTENMEVHHHAHNPAAPHHKKNWKAYFWEFLMLFLAVFCGFLAEWQLEHVIEHSREKEFLESMIGDLKTDSATLARMTSSFVVVCTHIDSLIPLLKDNEQLEKHATEIYQQQVYLNFFTKWIYADRTIDQLKNSGNFRLIKNKAVSYGISKYDGFIRNYVDDMQKTLIQKQWQGIYEAGNDIFKSSVFRAYFNSGHFTQHSVILPDSPYFLTNDKIVLQKFINKLDQYVVYVDWFRDNIGRALQQNMSLDSLIKKEYNLE